MNFADAVFEQVQLDREKYFFFDLYFVIGVFEELFHYFKTDVWDENSDKDLENLVKIASICQLAAEKVLAVEEQENKYTVDLKTELNKYKKIVRKIITYIQKNATEGSSFQKGGPKQMKVEFTKQDFEKLLEYING